MTKAPRLIINKRNILAILIMAFLLISILPVIAQDDDSDYCDPEVYDDCDEYCDPDVYDDCDEEFYDDEYYDDEYEDCDPDVYDDCDVYYEDYEDYDGEFYDEDYGDEYYEENGDEYFDDDFSEAGGAEEVETSYAVSNLALVGDPEERHQQMWDAVVAIIPPEWVQRVSTLEIISDPETSGYVYGDDNDSSKFVLALNVVEFDDQAEFTHTIIHEFAHIVSLNEAQFDDGQGSCSTLQLDEGCTTQNSFIYQFHSQFWTDGIDSDVFVSDYASSDVAEDFSESFTAFVLGQDSSNPRVEFFGQFPALLRLRDQIRSNIGVAAS
jgi:hypothetical protein